MLETLVEMYAKKMNARGNALKSEGSGGKWGEMRKNE